MKRIILTVATALVLLIGATAYAVDDPGVFFDKIIYNGPSQEVISATRGDDNDTSISVSRCGFVAPASSVSFRGYWAGKKVTPLMTFPGLSSSYNYSSYTNFGPGSTVTLMGSIPQNAQTPASASVGANWYR